MSKKSLLPPGPAPACQLKALIDAQGAELIIRGREYRFDNIRPDKGIRWVADAHTLRAKYLAMQTAGKVIGRPGAEAWAIFRTSGGGARLAKFSIHEGKLLELV